MDNTQSNRLDSNTNDPPLVHAIICPHCGAPGDADQSVCWLCLKPRTSNPYAAVNLVVAEGAARSETLLTLLIVGCFLLAFFVVLGLMSGSPGVLILVAIVAVPAFAVALPRIRGQSASTVARTDRVVRQVVVSFAIAGGVMGLLIVAAGVLLFLFCLGITSPNWR